MQLEAVKAERGGRVEDGAVAPSKPLAEVLREAKEAKEEAFQAMWRQMKTGAGTRPRGLGGRLHSGSALWHDRVSTVNFTRSFGNSQLRLFTGAGGNKPGRLSHVITMQFATPWAPHAGMQAAGSGLRTGN